MNPFLPRHRCCRAVLFAGACVVFAAFMLPPAARAQDVRPAVPQSDARPLVDPTRPVTEISPTSVTLQWFTREPCSTRVQIREGDVPMTAFRGRADKADPFARARVVTGPSGANPARYHVLRVNGLRPGRRYFYRLYDPAAQPTRQETAWGAVHPWRREWAVSTQAAPGYKTIIRLPVKVLLLPNVVNVASAHDPTTGTVAPPPAKMTAEDLARIRQEYAITSRFFFVNSGMRYWVDFHVFVDNRWQRWGDEPAQADAFYKGWPVSRSYAGQDFAPPGGGTWTIVDTKNPERVTTAPVVEARPYAGQIEQAFVRRWNIQTRKWEFVGSGGGTFGVDGFPNGVPGRSQYLGGSDTAWLAAHEFHHQMESEGAFSFADREDERIVFDHPAPRQRTKRPDGTWDDNAWNTAGRHGEHWDVLAFWDRTLTDAQWLRIYFGETVVVTDADADGVPDSDPRLPLDEKRFGSSAKKAKTDGRLNDLAKIMLSTWAPAPLQFSLNKPPSQAVRPDPIYPDTDRDGLFDDVDPYPLYPYAPFIWPLRATIDGNATEWANVPVAGRTSDPALLAQFRQAYDDAAYYGQIALLGPWKRVRVTLDGEGRGAFSGVGVQGFEITRPDNGDLSVRPQWGGAPGLAWKSSEGKNGVTAFEFSLPNRGEGMWFWDKGGREIGVAIEVTADDGKIYSVYEPYRLFYARMLESSGRDPLPAGAPRELTRDQATKIVLPGDPDLKFTGMGWKQDGNVLRHSGENESAAYLDNLNASGDFDLWMRFEAKQDAILGAFLPATKELSAGNDYIAFVGGYANTVSRLRLFGREMGDADARLSPGPHTLQLSRRAGTIWCLFDNKPILYAPDPNPKQTVDRLAVIGGYNGDQVIHEICVRVVAPAAIANKEQP